MIIKKAERRFITDTRLNELANLVADIKFGLTVEDIDHFNVIYQAGNLRNVTRCANNKAFRIRLFLGGKQRVLGVHPIGASAAAYADCARLFFWNYRLRDIRPPSPSDFNYSLERAQELLVSHESLGSHLEAIQKHLAAFGDLREASPADEDQRKQRKQVRASRRTVKAELRQLLADQMAEIVVTRETVDNCFSQVKVAFHHILERLDKLDAGQTGGVPVNKANTNA